MIARIWKGVTPSAKADEYNDYLSATGVKDYLATEGNRGILVLRRAESENCTEFLLVSLWDSLDAIRRFAGPGIERAVYYPEDEQFLLRLEPNVTHYEVVTSTTAGIP